MMQLLVTSDSTDLAYWLNWRVLLCALWVLTPMCLASLLIWKYEYYYLQSEKGRRDKRAQLLHVDELWRSCVKEVHPILLLVFRLIAFILLLVTLIIDFVVHGGHILYYYTQWTFTLVTIYFGFATVLSIYGCYQQHYRMCRGINVHHVGMDAEQGLYVPLTHGEAANGIKTERNLHNEGNNNSQRIVGTWSFIFQVLFQMSVGAVTLTDCVYWFLIFPFLNMRDYEVNYLTVLTHSLNAVVLLGDATLNRMWVPWFRITYFILWTGIYVIFQWIVHACVSMWWPYPILDLSRPYAPLWYLVVALLHIPCYGAFALIVETKHYLLSRWFPRSYECFR